MSGNYQIPNCACTFSLSLFLFPLSVKNELQQKTNKNISKVFETPF